MNTDSCLFIALYIIACIHTVFNMNINTNSYLWTVVFIILISILCNVTQGYYITLHKW